MQTSGVFDAVKWASRGVRWVVGIVSLISWNRKRRKIRKRSFLNVIRSGDREIGAHGSAIWKAAKKKS